MVQDFDHPPQGYFGEMSHMNGHSQGTAHWACGMAKASDHTAKQWPVAGIKDPVPSTCRSLKFSKASQCPQRHARKASHAAVAVQVAFQGRMELRGEYHAMAGSWHQDWNQMPAPFHWLPTFLAHSRLCSKVLGERRRRCDQMGAKYGPKQENPKSSALGN